MVALFAIFGQVQIRLPVLKFAKGVPIYSLVTELCSNYEKFTCSI